MNFNVYMEWGVRFYDEIVPQHLCRIYAPVGHHEDLLAYLVRRLLENGAMPRL